MTGKEIMTEKIHQEVTALIKQASNLVRGQRPPQ